MSVIQGVDWANDYEWGSGGTPTWNAFDDFLAESLEPGVEDMLDYDMGDGTAKQDGVHLNGEVLVIGDTFPAKNERVWLRFRTKGSAADKVVGGESGVRVSMGDSNIRPIGDGEPYTHISFNETESERGKLIEDDQS